MKKCKNQTNCTWAPQSKQDLNCPIQIHILNTGRSLEKLSAAVSSPATLSHCGPARRAVVSCHGRRSPRGRAPGSDGSAHAARVAPPPPPPPRAFHFAAVQAGPRGRGSPTAGPLARRRASTDPSGCTRSVTAATTHPTVKQPPPGTVGRLEMVLILMNRRCPLLLKRPHHLLRTAKCADSCTQNKTSFNTLFTQNIKLFASTCT